MKNKIKTYKIGVIGLGYVGNINLLPLSLKFAEKNQVIGFQQTIIQFYAATKKEFFRTKKKVLTQIEKLKVIKFLKKFYFLITKKLTKKKNCNIFIITVPTPVNSQKKTKLI